MSRLMRIGIFLFRDEKGIVDDYVTYLLNDMNQNLEKLYIVVNGALSNEGKNALQRYTDNLIIRPDVGFDVGGWQDAILNYCGFEEILKYDELILFNDSFFGPLYPFKEVFRVMDEKDVDFWGLSSHGAAPGMGTCPYGDRPRYLQTYFLGFRKKLIKSWEFQNFWRQLPVFEKFEEVGEGFGCVFTKGFEDLGYKWAVYSDTSDLESEDIRKNMSYHTFNPYEMVVNRKFPIIKRKLFVTGKDTTLRFNYGDELRKLLNYVSENTDYNLSMIYKYLLRSYNLFDLKNSLNLNYIIPNDVIQAEEKFENRKVAIIAHLFYPELFGYCIGYLKNIPENFDIIITISDEEKKLELENKYIQNLTKNVKVRLVKARGRDLSALLVGCHDLLLDYDYLCFLHDKRSVQKEYITVGASFCDLLWENMLKSREYIYNVLNVLEKNSHIGLLVPPNVYHGTYYCSSVNYWTICYEKTKELAASMGITSKIEKNRPPVSVGTVFWCKPKALQNLFEFPFEYNDFPSEPLPNDGSISHVLERLIPYVAQHHGFFTATVMNAEYAEAEVTNFRYMLLDMQKALSGMPGVKFATHRVMINSINSAKKEYQLLKQNSKIVEKIVYVPTNKANIQIIEHQKKNNEDINVIEQKVVEQIGLKGAFVNYIQKKGCPAFIVRIIRKIVKY